eukprot:1208575-Alexandrium_andersonii.AAC.1
MCIRDRRIAPLGVVKARVGRPKPRRCLGGRGTGNPAPRPPGVPPGPRRGPPRALLRGREAND